MVCYPSYIYPLLLPVDNAAHGGLGLQAKVIGSIGAILPGRTLQPEQLVAGVTQLGLIPVEGVPERVQRLLQ